MNEGPSFITVSRARSRSRSRSRVLVLVLVLMLNLVPVLILVLIFSLSLFCFLSLSPSFSLSPLPSPSFPLSRYSGGERRRPLGASPSTTPTTPPSRSTWRKGEGEKGCSLSLSRCLVLSCPVLPCLALPFLVWSVWPLSLSSPSIDHPLTTTSWQPHTCSELPTTTAHTTDHARRLPRQHPVHRAARHAPGPFAARPPHAGQPPQALLPAPTSASWPSPDPYHQSLGFPPLVHAAPPPLLPHFLLPSRHRYVPLAPQDVPIFWGRQRDRCRPLGCPCSVNERPPGPSRCSLQAPSAEQLPPPQLKTLTHQQLHRWRTRSLPTPHPWCLLPPRTEAPPPPASLSKKAPKCSAQNHVATQPPMFPASDFATHCPAIATPPPQTISSSADAE